MVQSVLQCSQTIPASSHHTVCQQPPPGLPAVTARSAISHRPVCEQSPATARSASSHHPVYQQSPPGLPAATTRLSHQQSESAVVTDWHARLLSRRGGRAFSRGARGGAAASCFRRGHVCCRAAAHWGRRRHELGEHGRRRRGTESVTQTAATTCRRRPVSRCTARSHSLGKHSSIGRTSAGKLQSAARLISGFGVRSQSAIGRRRV